MWRLQLRNLWGKGFLCYRGAAILMQLPVQKRASSVVTLLSVSMTCKQVVTDPRFLSGAGAEVSPSKQPHFRVSSVGRFPGAFQWDLLLAVDKKYWNVLKVPFVQPLYF